MIEFTVVPDNGDQYQLTAGSRDIVLWEKAHRGASFSQIKDNLTMTALYQIAHVAARRQGTFTGTLDEFEQQNELVFTDSDEPDPTQPAL